VDMLSDNASEELIKNAKDLGRLEDASSMIYPLPGESIEDWIDREWEPLADPDWRCPGCKDNFRYCSGDDACI
jgi:hypothetical protein